MAAVDVELGEFCRAQHRRVVGLLSLYVGDAGLAEELAQDVFVKVIAHWEDVERMDRPEAWTMRVAVNVANSWLRRKAAARRAQSRLEARTERHPGGTLTDDRANAVAVRSAVAALPPRQRLAVVLRYYADLSVAETAAEMRCTEGTVKTLTSTAISRLRASGLGVEA